MNAYMQQFALIEMSITCAVIIVWFIRKLIPGEISFLVRLILIFILSNLFFWPWGLSMELPLAAYVRGATGDLSMVTVLLLWSSLIPNHKSTPTGFKALVSLVAVLFYPLALGLGMLDPYAWGYHSLALLIAVSILAIVCGVFGWVKGVWILSLAIIAWSVHWHESTNFWDYLMDPFLAIWAISSLCYAAYCARREKRQSGYLFRSG